jgi:hypothetical protein
MILKWFDEESGEPVLVKSVKAITLQLVVQKNVKGVDD